MDNNENISSNTDAQYKTKFCMYCGEKIAFDAVICPKCGRQVEMLKYEQSKKDDTPIVINNNTNANAIAKSTAIVKPKKRYTFFSFLFDVFMICITGGLWLIWMILRSQSN